MALLPILIPLGVRDVWCGLRRFVERSVLVTLSILRMNSPLFEEVLIYACSVCEQEVEFEDQEFLMCDNCGSVMSFPGTGRIYFLQDETVIH